ncbi:MAG TPA: cellulase family glycosylhydrolase [Chitinophagaceae bacterium]|nr:cellulase family glycosylhydrolase [Chitinophagaceae bacterium]
MKGWYAWAWSPSPGHSRVIDTAYYPLLKKYVQDILQTFKNDPRILIWDMYNEPTNGGMGDKTLPLLRKVFHWAREINPSQPLTVATFGNNKKLNDIIFSNSDIITFHDYAGKEEVQKHIASLKQEGRPMVCTEWLNRPLHSTVEEVLPVFFKEKVGCLSWGLVNGETQTDLPWGHRPGDPPPKIWQHDLYHRDLKPYRKSELMFFEKYIKNKSLLRKGF